MCLRHRANSKMEMSKDMQIEKKFHVTLVLKEELWEVKARANGENTTKAE